VRPNPEGHCKPLSGRKPDPDAGERPWAARRRDALDPAALEAGRAKQEVDGGHH
jgi:hypothetical protein